MCTLARLCAFEEAPWAVLRTPGLPQAVHEAQVTQRISQNLLFLEHTGCRPKENCHWSPWELAYLVQSQAW